MPGHFRLEQVLNAALDLNELWGRPVLGMAFVSAFYGTCYTVTADSLAARTRLSDDTARRWLDQMVLAGKAIVVNDHGRRHYRPTELAAQQTLGIISIMDRT